MQQISAKEYKTKHDNGEQLIHLELCKKVKFDHTNKWYMHNPESVLENETHKVLWDFEIQTDHITSARRPHPVIVKKKKKKKRTCRIMNFTVRADHWVKLKESEMKAKYLDLARKLKTKERGVDDDTSSDWCSWNNFHKICKATRRRRNQRTSRDHPDYGIIKIGHNTEKIPGDLLLDKLQ